MWPDLSPRIARRALWLSLLIASLVGCESTAFDLREAGEVNLTFSPEFMEGAPLEIEVEAVIDGVDDVDALEGDPRQWSVETQQGSPDLSLVSWTFVSNFRVLLRLQRSERARSGAHEVVLQINNHFGTFVARGLFFVFP